MFKPKIHEFLLSQGFKYTSDACWERRYYRPNDKLPILIYWDSNCPINMHNTSVSLYPLNDMDSEEVTLDHVKQTLINAGIEIKGTKMKYEDLTNIQLLDELARRLGEIDD